MISIDCFLDRVPSSNYNCFNFAREVWLAITGEDISNKLERNYNGIKSFKELAIPVSPCLVLMQRKFSTPHVGIFIDGSLLHLTEHGTQFQPLNIAKGYFKTIRFYR